LGTATSRRLHVDGDPDAAACGAVRVALAADCIERDGEIATLTEAECEDGRRDGRVLSRRQDRRVDVVGFLDPGAFVGDCDGGEGQVGAAVKECRAGI
jgi:hypothetical protein